MRLTDITLKNLKTPVVGVKIYFDDTLTGFGVRVSEAGTMSFVLTHGPRRQRETLGRVGVISLHDARNEARRRLAEYTLGKDKPFAISWDAAIEEYFEEKFRTLKPRTFADYKDRLGRHFRYGATKLSDLSPRDLHKSLDRSRHTPGEHLHAYANLRGFLRWAHRKHYLDRNPMERMESPRRLRARERVLTADELRRVWHAAGDDTFGKIVKMLILTGQRRGEIVGLTPDMIGANEITLPAVLTKNKLEHKFPTGDMVRALVSHPTACDNFLFPARGTAGTRPFNGFTKCKPKLDMRSGVYDWRLHDLRRTFASGLASLGVQLPVVERLLNHVSGSFGGIVGVYQRYDFMPEMHRAILSWESHIENLLLIKD